MKKFNLTEMGLKEMTRSEMVETEGGIIWFLVAAVAIIAGSSCEGRWTGDGTATYQGENLSITVNVHYDSDTTSCN